VIPGLREFLGATAKLLAVTKLAKWKTTAQMVAIAVLFASGVGTAEDPLGLHLKPAGIDLLFTAGKILLWIAAVLTLMTGWDYFRKAMPYLKDEVRR
jgi:CDP-diacylglycerol--glycerol-3-phosphate 3-phosphatidyltransferase